MACADPWSNCIWLGRECTCSEFDLGEMPGAGLVFEGLEKVLLLVCEVGGS